MPEEISPFPLYVELIERAARTPNDAQNYRQWQELHRGIIDLAREYGQDLLREVDKPQS
jgi:hypothetical protein